MIDFVTFTKMPKNVKDLGKLIVVKGFKSCPKSNKSPNLVTLNQLYSQFVIQLRGVTFWVFVSTHRDGIYRALIL